MWSAGAGFSAERDARTAARTACREALERSSGADAALVFAGSAHRAELKSLLETARGELGTRRIVGGLGHGVLGSAREEEDGAGVAVLALSGLEAEPLWLPDLAGREERLAAELRARLGGGARAGDLVVLLPDPHALRPGPLLAAIAAGVGEAAVVGAGAGDSFSDAPLVWAGGEPGSGALAGLVLRGAARARVGVTQACRPLTPPLEVTLADGPWVLALDGRPALEVYREAAGGPLADDLPRAALTVLAALPAEETAAEAPLAPGSYRVRNIAGFAEARDAFAIPEPLTRGTRLALVAREPESARADLREMLAGVEASRAPGHEAGLALYFDCCARGAGFFGVPGLESAYLAQVLGETPTAGIFGSCELGPIAGRTELLTYTGVLAVLDRAEPGAFPGTDRAAPEAG